MKFAEYDIALQSEAMGLIEYAREFGMSADDMAAVWALGVNAAAQERHADPTAHAWLVNAYAYSAEHRLSDPLHHLLP